MSQPSSVDVATSLGLVRLRGRFASFHPDRPLVLAITGAFADAAALELMPERLPGADVMIAHLPGNHSPHLAETSIAAFARAFDEALAGAFAGRRTLGVGVSAGGLVVMAMRRLAAFVAADPPLVTGELWPLFHVLPERAALSGDPRMDEWVWAIFGMSRDRRESRDYRPLLEALGAPGVVLVAAEPLEGPRPFSKLPGLVSAADRERLARTPGVRCVVVPGVGHDIPEEAPGALLREVRLELRRLVGLEPPAAL